MKKTMIAGLLLAAFASFAAQAQEAPPVPSTLPSIIAVTRRGKPTHMRGLMLEVVPAVQLGGTACRKQ